MFRLSGLAGRCGARALVITAVCESFGNTTAVKTFILISHVTGGKCGIRKLIFALFNGGITKIR